MTIDQNAFKLIGQIAALIMVVLAVAELFGINTPARGEPWQIAIVAAAVHWIA